VYSWRRKSECGYYASQSICQVNLLLLQLQLQVSHAFFNAQSLLHVDLPLLLGPFRWQGLQFAEGCCISHYNTTNK